MPRPRMRALGGPHLALERVQGNVVGPHFIAVHEMLDSQVGRVREVADAVAGRIAALGRGREAGPALVAERPWDDCSAGRADAIATCALDLVCSGRPGRAGTR
ncbi:hypothetical protein [Streptomyces sp. AD55]|uniref:hypothetical protein n=1 Tax=Streptomyces sp. AD55 TaxID=3242895 RepID=UPI0035272AF8